MKCLRGFRVLLGAALALSLVLPAAAEAGTNTDFVKKVNGLPIGRTAFCILGKRCDFLPLALKGAAHEFTEQINAYPRGADPGVPAFMGPGAARMGGGGVRPGGDHRISEQCPDQPARLAGQRSALHQR